MVEDPDSGEWPEKRDREAEVKRERELRLHRSRQVRETTLAAAGKAEPMLSLEDLDQRLLTPKTNDLAHEMHERIAEGERRASLETSSSGNSAGYLPRVLEFHEQLLEEWAERLYTAYCEVCDLQNRSVSPELLRAIRDTPIATLIAARRSSVVAQAGLRGMRINDPPNPHALSEFSRRIDRFAVCWNLKMESDAAAIEYRVQNNRALHSQAVELSPKHIPPSSSVAGPDSRREAVIKKVQNPQAHTILTLDEAKLYFEVRLRTIYRWIDQGKLRSGPRRGSVTIGSVLQWQKKRSRKPRRD